MSVCRLLAPIAPFVSDWIHRELTGESVHLAPFVAPRGAGRRADLDARDGGDPDAGAAGPRGPRGGRDQGAPAAWRGWSASRPSVSEAALDPLVPLLAAELNVKRVEFATSGDELVTLEAKPNFRSLGKKFGKRTPLAAQAVAAFDERAATCLRARRAARR